MAMDISERIGAIKHKFGLKNTDLARLADVSKQAVGGWLNEGKIPSHDAAKKLRESLRVREDWLRLGVGEMMEDAPSPDQIKEEMHAYISSLPEEERAAAAGDLLKSLSKFL